MKFPPVNTIKAELGIQENGPVHAYFTERCWVHMGLFTPGGPEGDIHNSVQLKTDEIDYYHPGAHYQYTGIMYEDPVYHKGAFFNEDYGFWSRPGITKIPTGRNLKYHGPWGSHWDIRMWESKKDEVIDELQKYMDRS